MFTITGKIHSKGIIKQGVSEHGEWKILYIMIQKQFWGVKRKVMLVAKGKWATYVDKLEKNQRLVFRFYPDTKEIKPNVWATQLLICEIEKFIKRADKIPEGIIPLIPEETIEKIITPIDDGQLSLF